MPLREYFQAIHNLLASSSRVATFSLSYDERSVKAAFLRGTIALVDGSSLHFREFVVATPQIRKLKYAYHWLRTDGALIFRYDNAADPAAKSLPTFPHHKHTPSGIAQAQETTLGEVLDEIAGLTPRS